MSNIEGINQQEVLEEVMVEPRRNWDLAEVLGLFSLPFSKLIAKSHEILTRHFPDDKIQISALCSIKTGSCPENCSYCSQSAHHNTGLKREPLMTVEAVKEAAVEAKKNGAQRFCMAAAWRGPNGFDLIKVMEMIKEVKRLGLETCASLGILKEGQAQQLKSAGLDYYNHNIDTSQEFYGKIITTRTFKDRIDTIEKVQAAGINVCCGGIIGLGEEVEDRASMLIELAKKQPKSVPINLLVRIPGTPLANNKEVSAIDFVRVIAVARIMMPQSYIRLSAGRRELSEEAQALCFFAGANSLFAGEKLLTTENPKPSADSALFTTLGINSSQDCVA